MPYVPREAIEIFENGGTTQDVVGKVKNFYGDPASARTARRWHLYWQRGLADPQAADPGHEMEINQEEIEAVVRLIKNNPLSVEEISDKIDRSVRSVNAILDEIERQGYNLSRHERQVMVPTAVPIRPPDRLPEYLVKNHRIVFGIVSDLHCGSKETQITNLRHFLSYARGQGVTTFFLPGDIFAGFGVYREQIVDLYLYDADSQIAAAKEVLGIRPEERWFVLGGNHDFSFMRNGGVDAVWQFCRDYDNVFYLGYDAADIPLTPQVGVRLWHPSGSVPYASSYRLQKGMERMAYEQVRDIGKWVVGGDGPRQLEQLIADSRESNPVVKVIIAGHLHIDAKVHQGGVLGIQAACFEGQTNYLKRKSLSPQIGGYIVELILDDSGMIVGERIEFRTYRPIERDYLNYPLSVPVRKPDEVKEVFSLP